MPEYPSDIPEARGGNDVSNNWVVENLENALETWNSKLSEIWRLLSESPTEFKGGGIWNVMVNINDALKAVGYALLVLFFLMGIMRQFNSFQEIKRPEQALKLFIRFVLAKAAVTWGLDLMMAMFTIVQGVISKIMAASGLSGNGATYLPQSMIQTIEDCGFWESIPLWAVTLIGSLLAGTSSKKKSGSSSVKRKKRVFRVSRFQPRSVTPFKS